MRLKHGKYAFIYIYKNMSKYATNIQNKNTTIHWETCLAVKNSYTDVDISSATKYAFARRC